MAPITGRFERVVACRDGNRGAPETVFITSYMTRYYKTPSSICAQSKRSDCNEMLQGGTNKTTTATSLRGVPYESIHRAPPAPLLESRSSPGRSECERRATA